MSTTDTSEKGLESLIVESLVKEAGYVQGTNEPSPILRRRVGKSPKLR
jgi:hypothetical protein